MEKIIIIFAIIMFILLLIVLIALMNQRQFNKVSAVMEKNAQYYNQELSNLKHQVVLDLNTFSNQVNESITSATDKTESKFSNLERHMNQGLQKGFDRTNDSFNVMSKHLNNIYKTQENLDSLSHDINELQKVLIDKKNRGNFGEIELYTILESVYGINENRYQKQYTLSNGKIADAVIKAPDPLGLIVIDSKFPLENYLKIYDEELSVEERNKAQNAFKQDIKKHLNDISSRYLISNETADIAFMFVPSEAVFAEIYGRHSDVVQYSYDKNVFIVSPTTLMAYVTALQSVYLGQERNEKVKEIQEEYYLLSIEFERFYTRFDDLNRAFVRMEKDFKELEITNRKIVNRFEKIRNVKLEKEED